ncbi:helix-turn-helix transcriptional regulator [Mesorhizobium sp.]|uniref:helix-turn-helix transcriptional regulator n=1 Tax=Mesorhizobium sp. TaxID=1871066 RepID=UPI003BAA7B15
MKHDDAGRIRVIHTRAGVGATAGVIQREALRFSHITIERPTLIMVRHGVKLITSSDKEWVIHSGEAIAIAGGHRFDVVNRPDARGAYAASWLVFEPSMLASLPSVAAPMTQSACALGRIEADFMEAFIRARDAICEPGRIPDPIARHRMREILLWLEGHGVSLIASPPRTFAERVRAILMSTLDGTWTAAMVARHLHMSEASLRRHLAGEGTSFTDLLADMRMSHALTLLQSTDYPVGHIARDVGYDFASRFAIRFRKRFGFAPTAIRGHRRADSGAEARAATV